MKGVMSPVRTKSPTGSSPSKISQENKTLKQEVNILVSYNGGI